jgi:biuret amidohydrolase
MSTGDRLRELVRPEHTTIITMELQKGIIGDEAILPALPVAVRECGMLAVVGTVCATARSKGVRIVHQTMRSRPDGAGQAINCKIFAIGAKRRAEDIGRPGAELVDELDVQPGDIEVPRMHGMTPFTGTELDAVVRNLGTKTVVFMGVSLNLGIMGGALSALDNGYQVVIVRDGVIGIPKEYGEAVLANSLSMIATIVTSDELLAAWA